VRPGIVPRAPTAGAAAPAAKPALLFSSAGRTCLIRSDGSGFSVLEFGVPNQATWQPAVFLADDMVRLPHGVGDRGEDLVPLKERIIAPRQAKSSLRGRRFVIDESRFINSWPGLISWCCGPGQRSVSTHPRSM
jgi:hypothetical protein